VEKSVLSFSQPKRKRILNGVVILYAELRRDTFQTVRDGEP